MLQRPVDQLIARLLPLMTLSYFAETVQLWIVESFGAAGGRDGFMNNERNLVDNISKVEYGHPVV